MILIAYLIGFIIYLLQCWISYRTVPMAWAVAIATGALTASTWLYIAKTSTTVYRHAVYWDLMIFGTYLVLPLVMGWQPLTTKQLIAVPLLLIGTWLLH